MVGGPLRSAEANRISSGTARSTATDGICRCRLIPSIALLAIRWNFSRQRWQRLAQPCQGSSTANSLAYSGLPPNCFFHFARSVG